MVADRNALGRWKAPHYRYHFFDMGIAVAVDERQSKHTDIQAFEAQEMPLGGELADRVRSRRRTRVVFTSETATRRTVDQAGTDKDKTLNGRGLGGAGERSRSEVIRGVRLFCGRPSEECGAVDYGVDAAERGGQGGGLQQV